MTRHDRPQKARKLLNSAANATVPFKELIGHDPTAPNVVIMSVVVDPAEQGKGHSRALTDEFVGQMRRKGKQRIHLMCKDHHVPLYEKFGYEYSKPSASEHGGMTWHEMVMTL
ncbi:GNAT family N-acetyltransferase [Yoonia sp. R2331]|uniref:GNAT family N-acetyltransferase n=1 Tax=Yoonia sp. R2331 TaxID=3237238 RepID=UPI0034E58856